MDKLYAERNPEEQDELGNHYSKHVRAMTAESLHSKAAIAAELAHRDILLQSAQEEIKRLREENKNQVKEIVKFMRKVHCDADIIEQEFG